ncbi:recombinase family protein [Faecalicatena acetigenes]|uniref:Recombinase family protein n=1 Tax=Faecalicatena acetigenes TaxID=2981790 RepID=A0ABT2TE24_9FIRM|nr:recombinase family protein [Faecalicatena acetigenes]MCU6748545.1 recombinase family protein [Faecalicatena acetigenes]SCI50665.1 Resolvase%2C N terminal domain [uncultured Clostridium sp.]
MKTKYGYGYVRVSTDKQEELSPDSQSKLLKDFAHKNGIILLNIFFEIGVSGRKAEKRPEFQKMIALAKSKDHPVDSILVWKFSRFARNQEESIVYKSLLKKKHNVDVISVSEPLVDGPFGSLIERIIEWMDEYYSVRLSGEVTRGMKEKAQRGGYQARPPLGYRIVDRGEPPVIVPKEAEIIKIIFDKYANEHCGIFDIARYLNLCGFKTSHGKPFERRSVEYILQNPTYCGMIRWNRTVNETNEIRPKDEWIITKGLHPAIISEELFNKAMSRYEKEYISKGSRPSSTYKHWLSGLVKCPSCGRTMIAKTIKGSARTYVYFTCYGYSKGKCLLNNSVSSLKLEPAVLQSVKDVLDSHRIAYRYVKPKAEESTDLSAILKEQLKKSDEKLDRIKEAYRNGVDTLAEYKASKSIIAAEIEQIKKQLEEVEKTIDAPSNDDSIMLDRVRNVYEIISSDVINNTTKNEILKSVIEKIVYDRDSDELKVYYYYTPEPL